MPQLTKAEHAGMGGSAGSAQHSPREGLVLHLPKADHAGMGSSAGSAQHSHLDIEGLILHLIKAELAGMGSSTAHPHFQTPRCPTPVSTTTEDLRNAAPPPRALATTKSQSTPASRSIPQPTPMGEGPSYFLSSFLSFFLCLFSKAHPSPVKST